MINNIKAIFNINSIPAIWMLLILSATSSAQISDIVVSPGEIELARGGNTVINVSLDQITGLSAIVIVNAGDGLSVEPSLLTFTTARVGQNVTVTATAAERDDEPYKTSLVAFSADGYQSIELKVVIEGEFTLISAGVRTETGFGDAIAISENDQVMVVGESCDGAGYVHVYTKGTFGNWEFAQRLSADGDRNICDEFGSSVAISDDGRIIAIGAPGNASSATGINSLPQDPVQGFEYSGAAYLFERGGNQEWTQTDYLKASNTGGEDEFGWSVALDRAGNTLAVGALNEDSENDALQNSGAVYVFVENAERYITAQTPPSASTDLFGTSVVLSGDGLTLAVGTPRGDQSSGAVYVFTRPSADSSVWTQSAYIQASNANAVQGGEFGNSVALSDDGTILVASAHLEDIAATGINPEPGTGQAENSGAVYVFARINDSWQEQAYIKASNSRTNAWFGYSVGLNSAGNQLVVGAPYIDDGAVYLFGFDEVLDTWVELTTVASNNQHSGQVFGVSVALSGSGDGSLAIGSIEESLARRVEVYDLDSVIPELIISPRTLSIVEGSIGEVVNVGLEGLIGDTAEIEVTVGEDLQVSPSLLTFTNTNMQSVRLTALDIDHDTYGYTTRREVIFTADRYLSQRIIVTIEGEVGGIGFDLSEDVISVTEGDTTTVSVEVFGTEVSTAVVTAKIETDTGEGIQLPQFDVEVTLGTLRSNGLVVIVARDNIDMGDRISTITLSAVGYDPAVLRVEIMESDEPPLVLVPVVSITSFERNDSIQVSETVGSVTLRLTVSPPATQMLTVDVNYTGDVGALTGNFSSVTPDNMSIDVTVPANTAERTFVIPVVDDQIAAESTRTASIVLGDGSGYTVSDTASTVTIAVEDDDVATVSISSLRDQVTEGDTIVFTITRDLAIDQASSITLTLTHNGDFFSEVMTSFNFGTNYLQTGINLELTDRHKRDGKVYYRLDHSTDDPRASFDRVNHNLLDNLLNGGFDTVNTQPDGHDGSDDERSVIIGDYAFVLPTINEIRAFREAALDPDPLQDYLVPDNWVSGSSHWSASPSGSDHHLRTLLNSRANNFRAPDDDGTTNSLSWVFFQVLTAQRTIVVDFPAPQTSVDIVMVEVPTIDMADSMTDGSLTAKLIAVTSPIELDSPNASEVAILHNNAMVTVAVIWQRRI